MDQSSAVPSRTLEELLEKELDRGEKSPLGAAFMYSYVKDESGQEWGSYKIIRRSDLVGRGYELTMTDGRVSIFFTDVVYDRNHHKVVPKPGLKAAST